MNKEIRQLNTSDTQNFCNLIIDMYGHLENLEWFTPMPYDFDNVKKMIENERFYIIGYFLEGVLCGVSSLDYKCGKIADKLNFPKEVNINNLVEIGFNIVHSFYRGKGIMKEMVSFLLNKIKQDKFEWCFAKVHKDNLASSKSILNNNFNFCTNYLKPIKISDFLSLSNQPFFSKLGKQNAEKTLSNYSKDDTEIIVNYNIYVKKL